MFWKLCNFSGGFHTRPHSRLDLATDRNSVGQISEHDLEFVEAERRQGYSLAGMVSNLTLSLSLSLYL